MFAVWSILRAVATVLTACGIETQLDIDIVKGVFYVATVLTACGIETLFLNLFKVFSELQQYLPLAVLKPLA